jgi:uncharacterized alpha-E superfamily protein
MLSRVADAIYWSSRYVERAENAARFVDVNLNLMLDTPIAKRDGWEPLVLTTGDQEWYYKHYEDASPEKVAWFLTFDRSYPNSLISTLSLARENAQNAREVLSREMWQELNEVYLMVREASRRPFTLGDMSAFYDRIKLAGIHYEGVTNATLSRGEAWHFARLGRLLERADKTSRILDVKYYLLQRRAPETEALDQIGWTALLNSVSGLQMYRQLYHFISPENVTSFLLLNRHYPRAINYCTSEAQQSLHAITGTPLDISRFEPERLLGQLRARLSYDLISDVMEAGLHEYIDTVQERLNEIGAATQGLFFDDVPYLSAQSQSAQ